MKKVNIGYLEIYPLPSFDQVLNTIIDTGSNVLILGAYCSGAVPKSLIPSLKRARKKGIPVFSIRQTKVDEWYTEWSDYKEQLLPGMYQYEAEAIGEGLIPLQKDLVRRDEVINGIRKICEQHPDYQTRVSLAIKEFSSPEFNKQLNDIRTQYGLPRIE